MNSAKKASTSNQKKTVTFWGHDTRAAKYTTYIYIYNVYKMYMYLNLFMAKHMCSHGYDYFIYVFFFFADGSILMINITCVGAGHRLISHGKWSSTIYKKKLFEGQKDSRWQVILFIAPWGVWLSASVRRQNCLGTGG